MKITDLAVYVRSVVTQFKVVMDIATKLFDSIPLCIM